MDAEDEGGRVTVLAMRGVLVEVLGWEGGLLCWTGGLSLAFLMHSRR